MLHAVELGRGAVHHALWALDAAPPAEAHRAALVAKAWASESFAKVAADAIQVFGGVGFTWEHDAHLYYKRLLGLEQSLGGARACYDALAAAGIG
jgi:alkylation response protein AidB-like acyl-CoA dehydrogenase